MTGQPWQEQGLRDAALRGNAQAWTYLFQEHSTTLQRYLLWRLGGTRQVLDDLAQETWLQAARSLSRFAPEQGSFQHWLLGIASNIVRNYLRSKRRSKQQPMPGNHDPTDQIESRKTERVSEALVELPDHYEAVLRAKYFHGSTVESIAREQSTTVKAIESLLTRARTAFKEVYDKESP